MKRIYYLGFVFLCLTIACEKPMTEVKNHLVFRYNESANINSLDPAFAKNQANIWAVNQLFNGLVALDKHLNVVPDLAKSWKVSNQNKTYEFLLRKNVYFHKHLAFGNNRTRAVTANDFVFSFDRLVANKTAAPGKWVFQNVAYYSAKNDSVLTITLHKSFPPFLSLLAMKYCSVVPKEVVAYEGENFRSNPIGTGPFKFKLWVENTKLVLRKNELYFEKDSKGKSLPYLEAVSITFLADKQSEFLQFLQGNLDVLNGVDASYKDELLTPNGTLLPKYQHKMVYEKSPFLNTEYLGFFVAKSSVENNIWIKKAIDVGFDRAKMLKYLRNNIGIPATGGFIPLGMQGYISKQRQYQPEKASYYVQQYRKQTGKNPVIAIHTNAAYLDLCEFLQRELQLIGIKVNIQILQPSALRQLKANGKLPLFRASWIADYPDAENFLSLFYSKNLTPEGPNYSHYKNVQFDKLYEKALSETNTAQRIKMYQAMDAILTKELPVIPLFYDENVRFVSNKVKGLENNHLNLLNLKMVQKER